MKTFTYKVTIEATGLVRCMFRGSDLNCLIGYQYFANAGSAHQWARSQGYEKA